MKTDLVAGMLIVLKVQIFDSDRLEDLLVFDCSKLLFQEFPSLRRQVPV